MGMSSVGIKQSNLPFREISYIVDNQFGEKKPKDTEACREAAPSLLTLRMVAGNQGVEQIGLGN